MKAEIKRIKKAPPELKRKYNQLDTEFKDLRESKTAELDAVNQRLDGIQKNFIRLNNKYGQLFKVISDGDNSASLITNGCYGEVG